MRLIFAYILWKSSELPPDEAATLSKYSLSMAWHSSTRFLCCLMMDTILGSGRGVVRRVNRCPNTRASSSVGLGAKKLFLFHV